MHTRCEQTKNGKNKLNKKIQLETCYKSRKLDEGSQTWHPYFLLSFAPSKLLANAEHTLIHKQHTLQFIPISLNSRQIHALTSSSTNYEVKVATAARQPYPIFIYINIFFVRMAIILMINKIYFRSHYSMSIFFP